MDVMSRLPSDLISTMPLDPEVLTPYDEKAIQKIWFESKVCAVCAVCAVVCCVCCCVLFCRAVIDQTDLRLDTHC